MIRQFGFRINFVYIILICISILGNLYFLFSDNEEYIKKYEDNIISLESRVDSLKIRNTDLDYKIGVLEKESDSLDIQIKVVKQERVDIIRSYEYYLKSILELNDTELEHWFIARYTDPDTE